MISIEFGLTILRLVFGMIFMGHGSQKLFGWFGGGGISGMKRMTEMLGFKPVRFWAFVAGASEFLGGLGLVLGFLTPIASASIIGAMLVAIIKVHWKNGVWNTNRGFEFPLLNACIAAFLGLFGPGLFSLDKAFHLVYPIQWLFVIALIIIFVGVLAGLISAQIHAKTKPSEIGSE